MKGSVSMSKNKFNQKSIEVQVLHPLVAQYLQENHYAYQHEVKMPEYGRADFIAERSDIGVLIVECKQGAEARSGRSIVQLVDYVRQIPHSRGAFALFKDDCSEYILDICSKYDIEIIVVKRPPDIEQSDQIKEYRPDTTYFDFDNFGAIAFFGVPSRPDRLGVVLTKDSLLKLFDEFDLCDCLREYAPTEFDNLIRLATERCKTMIELENAENDYDE